MDNKNYDVVDVLKNSISEMKDFLNWVSEQKQVVRGGRIFYDVKGYHKYLNENELYDYWLENIQ